MIKWILNAQFDAMFRKIKVLLFFILLLLVIAIIKIVFSYQSDAPTMMNTKDKEKSKAIVSGILVKSSIADDQLLINATLMPNEYIDVYPEISGRVVSIRFREGSEVRKGDTLLCLDDAEWRAELKQVQVQKEQASAQEKRLQKLLDVQGISQEAYDQVYFQLKGLEAQIELIQTQINKTRILAPFQGVLGLRYVSNGAMIHPGFKVTTLQQVRPLKLEFPVPEKYAWKLKKGDQVQFTLQASTRVYTAQVYAMDAMVQSESRTLLVRALTTEAASELMPGAYAKINLTIDSDDQAIMIPTLALIPVLKGQKVYILRNGLAEEVDVETGIRTSKEIQITSGLSVGDTVITTGIMGLKSGTPIQVNIRR